MRCRAAPRPIVTIAAALLTLSGVTLVATERLIGGVSCVDWTATTAKKKTCRGSGASGGLLSSTSAALAVTNHSVAAGATAARPARSRRLPPPGR